MYVCMCTTCMPSAHRHQKKALGSLELELQVAMSHYVMLGLELRSSAKATSSLNY